MTVIRAAHLEFLELPGRRSADPLAGLEAPVSARVVRIEPATQRTPHRHPHSLELVSVTSGHGIAWQDGTSTPIGPGDLVLVAQGTAHATLATPGETLELLCFFPHPELGANLEELDGPVLRIEDLGHGISPAS